MALQVTREALRAMFEHCQADYPNEACGFLAGKDRVAQRAVRLTNAHASPTSYEMDPKEQLKAQREIRAQRMEPLAIYHSHVATEAYPSRRDIDRATEVQDLFDGYYVLVTLEERPRPSARAFRIRDGNVSEEPLVEG